MFNEILNQYKSQFAYDEQTHTWCLFGTDENGNAWETDDYDAENREQAENDSIDYLAEYNQEID